ncbi:hypothetical protein [Hymenobacter negativus]|uniref:DUF1772 domain-containing protein n=1 Tax=Hymenobacter negativus TaxID=2795026 RepID=A0ABS3QEB9_9BACT|nr:hypothetical protein [Hymenobacter negativus]MBO2009590.1 hypothetical protein [Hymenobacter negativus]
MPLYFLLFLAMLAASLLLFLGAVATAAVTRRPLPIWLPQGAASPLQAAGVAALWFSVGACWLLYFNVYRIHVDMSLLGNAALQAFSRGYTRRLPIVVLPYGALCLLWTLALWAAPARVPRRAVWGIATLLVVSVASTPWAAGAQDAMQDHGYSEELYRQLQAAHLVRTLAITAAAVWALVAVWRVPKSEIHDRG